MCTCCCLVDCSLVLTACHVAAHKPHTLKTRCPFLNRWCGMQMVLKCADIGHLAMDPVTHKRWAFQLEEEFYKQVSSLICSTLYVYACLFHHY